MTDYTNVHLVPEEIRRQLAPGERLLWHGRPRQGLLLRGTDAYMIPFSLLWTGVVIHIMSGSLQGGRGRISPMFLPFIVGAVYFLAGRFFIDARQRACSAYAVTSERVLILGGVFSRKLTSLNLQHLNDITLSQKASGEGSIVFGRPQAVVQPAPGMDASSVVQPPAPPSFDLIPDAGAVHALIRDAQRRLLRA